MARTISDLNEVLLWYVQMLYDIEKQLEIALPTMSAAATDPELEMGFLKHFEDTKMHTSRLEDIFRLLEADPEVQKGETIRGLVADAQVVAGSEAPESVRDALLAAAGRTVEHYEMACYSNAIAVAEQLELPEVVELLEETLAEEEASEAELTTALESCVSSSVEES